MAPRIKQIEAMLNRAHERAERAPRVSEVLDHLLAPIYFCALCGAPGDSALAAGLVDHLLRIPVLNYGERSAKRRLCHLPHRASLNKPRGETAEAPGGRESQAEARGGGPDAG